MRTDSVIRAAGFQALHEKLDVVEAERFVALLNRNQFDYTEWRKTLWEDLTVEELSRKAMAHWNANNPHKPTG
ncbi:MAG: hypothetical protein HZA20_10700 [Nitrospirae bacterium]|nr:hypothetical protein [Nitrospirota bacterium]